MIYVTLGDPYSIFLETLAAAYDEWCEKLNTPIILLGSYWHFYQEASNYAAFRNIQTIFHPKEALSPGLYFFDVNPKGEAKKWPPANLTNRERGSLSIKPLYYLAGLNLDSRDIVVTGPINKKSCSDAGWQYRGHTEFFATEYDCEVLMLLASDSLKVGLVTDHIPLKEVSANLSKSLILSKLNLFVSGLKSVYSIENPKIAVCGLNPHCGDGGLIGKEEQEIIQPGINAFRLLDNSSLVCLEPADTAFLKAINKEYDGVLSMYHDQGLGPLKTLFFDCSVNITIGLPFLRISPDHGPAQDIYGKGIANPRSLSEAFKIIASQK